MKQAIFHQISIAGYIGLAVGLVVKLMLVSMLAPLGLGWSAEPAGWGMTPALAYAKVEPYTAEMPVAILSINPGYTRQNTGEGVEIVNLASESSISLAGLTVTYLYNNGESEKDLFSFPEGSRLTGEVMRLRYASSSDVGEDEKLTYTKTIAMEAGAVELRYNGTVIDAVCWGSYAETCAKKFQSATPTFLVRDLSSGLYEHLADYTPYSPSEGDSVYIPENSSTEPNSEESLGGEDADTDSSLDDPLASTSLKPCAEGYERNPETNRCRKITSSSGAATSSDTSFDETAEPQCTGLYFTEILSYYETDKSEQFIEIFNPGEETVNVTGCKLRYKKKLYGLAGVIAPSGYYVRDTADFTLTKNPTSENVVELMDVNGEVVDSLTYPHGQKKSTSWALFGYGSDGGGEWKTTYYPTPGMENIYQEYRSCPAGKVINAATGNCVKATTMATTLSDCPAGKYRNPATGRCKKYETESEQKPCAEGYERNPETNRCRKIKNNDGAGFALIPETGEEKTTFIAVAAVAGVLAVGLAYVVFQFRFEIKRGVGKIFRRLRGKSDEGLGKGW